MVKKKENYVRDSYQGYFPVSLEKIFHLEKYMKEIYENIGDLASKITGVFGIGILVFAFYFLAPNFTGNAILNFDTGSTNLVGVGLFFFGLLMVFACLKIGKK